MIVGWSPTSPPTNFDWSHGVAFGGVAEGLADVNSLLRDVDLEVARRLIMGSMFDLKYLGSPLFQEAAFTADLDGSVYCVDLSNDIYRLDPLIGPIDTGLNAIVAAVTGSSHLAPGEMIFWTGLTTDSLPTATLLHTNYSAVTTISNGAAGASNSPADYRYSSEYGRYYRIAATSGARTVQTATSVTGSWSDLNLNPLRISLDLNEGTGLQYVAVADTHTAPNSIEVYLDDDVVSSTSGLIVGTLASYNTPLKVWFWRDRLYMLVRDNTSSNWAIIRSEAAPGDDDLSANLVDLSIVYEEAGAITGTINVGSTQNMTSFFSSGTIFRWSLDGINWNENNTGSAGKVVGNRLWTSRSVSRWI